MRLTEYAVFRALHWDGWSTLSFWKEWFNSNKPLTRTPKGDRCFIANVHTSYQTGCIRKHACIWKNDTFLWFPETVQCTRTIFPWVEKIALIQWEGHEKFDWTSYLSTKKKKLLGEYTYLARKFNGELQIPLTKIFLMAQAAIVKRMLDGAQRLVPNSKSVIK